MKSSMFNYMIDKESQNAVVIKNRYMFVLCAVSFCLKRIFRCGTNERTNEKKKYINQLQKSRGLHYRSNKTDETVARGPKIKPKTMDMVAWRGPSSAHVCVLVCTSVVLLLTAQVERSDSETEQSAYERCEEKRY